MSKVSIIIRTRNEERWIGHCLRMVSRQSHRDFEVIIVDNRSTDRTLKIASQFPVRITTVDGYRPGLALNHGIRASDGNFIACLSAHCIPKHSDWLSNLLRNFGDPGVAGVYGRQVPLAFSSDADKRDLLITFGLDRRVQVKDAFFHNANSMVRRDVWERVPWDEEITNIEDRVWARRVLQAGYHLVYEPEAEVFHYHGIHQNQDRQRCRQVVEILQRIENGEGLNGLPEACRPEALNIVALLPVVGEPERVGSHDLLDRCVTSVRDVGFIRRIVPLTDRECLARRLFASDVWPVLRPPELSSPNKGLIDVLLAGLTALEERGEFPDVVLYVNYLFPFRPPELLRNLVTQLLVKGLDTVMAAQPDSTASFWIKGARGFTRIGKGFAPATERELIYRAVAGLGSATLPHLIRDQRLVGGRIELVPVTSDLHALKVTDEYSRRIAALFLDAEPGGGRPMGVNEPGTE